MAPSATQPASAAVAAPAECTGFLTRYAEVNGRRLPYTLYVPANYSAQRAWPVILFLHGSGERGADGLLQTEVGLGRAIRRHAERFPALVVMPQAPREEVWFSDAMLAFCTRTLDDVAASHRVDAQRVYLTGLSLGGAGVWHLAAREPQRFAAIVPVCGFAEWQGDTGVAQRLAPRIASIPTWVFHGAQDDRVPPERSRGMVDVLRAAGGQPRYTEFPEGNHLIWDQAYGEAGLWQWVFAQRRE